MNNSEDEDFEEHMVKYTDYAIENGTKYEIYNLSNIDYQRWRYNKFFGIIRSLDDLYKRGG